MVVVCLSSGILAADGLSSVGAPQAVATFECIGVVLDFSGDDNRNADCGMRYRIKGTADWHQAHPLFVDHRLNAYWGINTRQFRGSVVNLKPATTYEIEVAYNDADGGSGSKTVEATTWNETFPEGEAVEVGDRTTQLNVSQSGSASAYTVYRPAQAGTAVIDVANAENRCVHVDADYVIVRGLTLRGSQANAVQVEGGRHHVVIENCDITNWGPSGIGRLGGWDWSSASGIRVDKSAHHIVIQHNTIHSPRGGSNSWASGSQPWQTGDHPMGPQAISFNQSLGSDVIRFNRCWSEGEDHYYNDIVGGTNNGAQGNLKCDSDVYGNVVSQCWDDGLEIEGFNINVRIWGNVIHHAFKAIATANIGYTRPDSIDSSLGPHYIWRNVMYDCLSSATKIRGDGGYYFYHNTVFATVPYCLEAPNSSKSPEVKAFGIVKNNIILSAQPFDFSKVNASHGAKWFFDYNLYALAKSELTFRSGWGAHAVTGGSPVFDIDDDTVFNLALGSDGIDAGEVIPNFSDGYYGDAPDMGAFEYVPLSSATHWSPAAAVRKNSVVGAQLSVFDLRGRFVSKSTGKMPASIVARGAYVLIPTPLSTARTIYHISR